MKFKIADICDINESNLSSKDTYETIKYLDTANLNEGIINALQTLAVGKDKVPSRAKRKVKNNDILISTVRPNQKHYGILKNIEDNIIVSTGFAVLSPKGEIVDSEYLYRFLTQYHITEYLQSIAETSTSTFPAIKPNVIGELEILLPQLQDQKAISSIFSSLDKKIELNNQMNKTLEEMAQALFKRWFVDFEFPNEDGEPYKSSDGEMVESELGMIPEGWCVKKIQEIGDVVAGGTPSTKNEEYYDGDIPWITPKDLSGYDRKFISKGERSITELGLQKSSAKLMKKGTVLFSSRAPIGYIVIAENDVSTNQGFKSVICNKEVINNNYVYHFLKYNKEKIENLASGSTFKEVSGAIMKMLDILVPTIDILNRFRAILESYDKILSSNYIENDSLIELRDSLLPKLMSGEISVDDVEANL